MKIATLVKSLPDESLNRSHLNEIGAILEMNVYLVSSKIENGYFIGNILS